MTRNIFIIIVMIALIITGCSGGGNKLTTPPISEIPTDIERTPGGDNHVCLGLWQFHADPVGKTLEFVEMRDAAFHLNALMFLEPPPFLNLSLESLEFNGNEIIADIGLRHPFLGLTEFTGFDVCGIFISNGSHIFGETGMSYAGAGDTHLLNPDGYARWWNPTDFPQDGSILGYKDGLLGTPDGIANFNTQINPYKYYSDEFTNPDADILTLTPSNRGQFSAGQKNIRRFQIELGNDGLTFNYAVDANWSFPQGDPPYNAPDDFPPDANRSEAWAVDVTETNNTLYNNGASSGGALSLSIDVYDHYNPELNLVRVESPGNFSAVESGVPTGGGDGFSTYEIDITSATPDEGSILLYFIIESDEEGYGGKIPGEPVTAYFIGSATVSVQADTITVTAPNGGEVWTFDTSEDITWTSTGGISDVKIEYSKDNFASDVNTIVDSTPNDGTYAWTVPIDPSDTARVRISDVTDAAVNDISDADFTIFLSDCMIYVDDDNTGGPWDGSESNPYKLIQDAVDAVSSDGCFIWVHPGVYNEDSGGSNYSGLGEVTITGKTNLTIYGENYPTLHMPMYLGVGRAAIRGVNCPGLTIDGIGYSHNYAYQSANWFQSSSDVTIRNCKMVPTLSPYGYGFLEFVRASSCPNLTIENNDCDDFNTASTFMSLFVLSGCSNALITLNTARNMNPNTGYNMNQTAEGYVSVYSSSNVEISKNIFGDHHRSSPSTNYVRHNSIYISGGSNHVVRNNLIYDCYFRSSAGQSNNNAIEAYNCTGIDIYNNTIDRFGPVVASGTGYTTGIIVSTSTSVDVYNNIVSNIKNPQDSWGIYGNSAFTATYSDVWNVTGGNPSRYGGSATEGTGGIDDDPLFTDPLTEDYTLQAGSPCAGTGQNGEDMGCHGGSDPLP